MDKERLDRELEIDSILSEFSHKETAKTPRKVSDNTINMLLEDILGQRGTGKQPELQPDKQPKKRSGRRPKDQSGERQKQRPEERRNQQPRDLPAEHPKARQAAIPLPVKPV